MKDLDPAIVLLALVLHEVTYNPVLKVLTAIIGGLYVASAILDLAAWWLDRNRERSTPRSPGR